MYRSGIGIFQITKNEDFEKCLFPSSERRRHIYLCSRRALKPNKQSEKAHPLPNQEVRERHLPATLSDRYCIE